MRSFRSIRVVNLLSFNMLSLSPFILIIYRDTQPNSYLFRSFRFMHFAFSYINRPLSTWCVLDAWSMFFIAANLIVYALCQFFPIRLDSTRLDPTRPNSIRYRFRDRAWRSFGSCWCFMRILFVSSRNLQHSGIVHKKSIQVRCNSLIICIENRF